MSNNQHFPKISLFLGGTRSGKSQLAEQQALNSGLSPVYLATAQVGDAEMESRIESHQQRRGNNWRLIEEPLSITDHLAKLAASEIILIDCLTLWLSNLMLAGRASAAEQEKLLNGFEKCAGKIICVSSEVGLGIVPDNKLGRDFRDAQGVLNQNIAAHAELVVFATAGLPLVIKGKIPESNHGS